MKIRNPIDQELNLNFRGENYTIEAKGVKEFDDEVAKQWLLIYSFMGQAKPEPVEEKKVVKKAAKKVASNDKE